MTTKQKTRGFELVSKYESETDNLVPRRATKKSACYDVFNNTGEDIVLKPGEMSGAITTKFKAYMLDDEVLKAFVRSGHGFKYSVRLANSTGIIDCVPKGTLIETPDGKVKVEELMTKENAVIYSYNEEKDITEEDIITDMWIVNDKPLLKITTSNNTVTVPEDKEVFTKRGWIKAIELTTNDEILSLQNLLRTVETITMQYEKVTHVESVPTEPIYHLTVDKNHNFFGNNLCLHNCDYYNNVGNEGEIFVKLHNQGEKELVILIGEAMAQMMFQKYLIADNDSDTVGGTRTGGIGSTTN